MMSSDPTHLTTTSVDPRATEFRAVEGGTETRSGTVLLVEAYAAIWLILFVMLVLGFLKQRRLDARIGELEKVLDRARGES
jgi:hypothetical protein